MCCSFSWKTVTSSSWLRFEMFEDFFIVHIYVRYVESVSFRTSYSVIILECIPQKHENFAQCKLAWNELFNQTWFLLTYLKINSKVFHHKFRQVGAWHRLARLTCVVYVFNWLEKVCLQNHKVCYSLQTRAIAYSIVFCRQNQGQS